MILHLNSFISLAFVSTRYALFVSHRLVAGGICEVVPTFLSRLQLLRCFNESNVCLLLSSAESLADAPFGAHCGLVFYCHSL